MGFRNWRRSGKKGRKGREREWFCTLAQGMFSQRKEKKQKRRKRRRRINYFSYLEVGRGKTRGAAIATAIMPSVQMKPE